MPSYRVANNSYSMQSFGSGRTGENLNATGAGSNTGVYGPVDRPEETAQRVFIPPEVVPGPTSLTVVFPQYFDTTPPTPNITAGPSVTRISRVSGKDSFTFDWQANEDFEAYQVRLVSNSSDTYVQGAQLEIDESPANGGTSGATYTSTITDDELVNAGGADGANLIKVFVQDLRGNWSA